MNVLIIERYPDIPGHAAHTKFTRAKLLDRTRDNRYWLVRPVGLFRRRTWLPRRGVFVSMVETK